MHDGVRRFIADCASSSVGRFMFVAYLVYVVSMIGYAYGHIPYMTYPFRFYGERELFELMNWPQIELIRSSRLIFRWQASKVTDALAAVYIALPWWVYGHIFERVALRIMDRAPNNARSRREFETFDRGEQPKRLQASKLFEWIGAPRAKERMK